MTRNPIFIKIITLNFTQAGAIKDSLLTSQVSTFPTIREIMNNQKSALESWADSDFFLENKVCENGLRISFNNGDATLFERSDLNYFQRNSTLTKELKEHLKTNRPILYLRYW